MDSRAWKHVFKFDGPLHDGDKEHFNLVQFDAHDSTLLVCNSFRSSIFAVPLDFQPLPEFESKHVDQGRSSRRARSGLAAVGHPALVSDQGVRPAGPCTSVSISPDAEAGKPSRLFVVFPEGVSILRLLVFSRQKMSLPRTQSPPQNRSHRRKEPEAQPRRRHMLPSPKLSRRRQR